ncbi:AlpA family phage regulatory protein [Microvirga tunisiensis]|uniref:AlpA family phage regulatory protein n=1 Tax=Pannonibacter tanglangensis TaxID=2750084 RepID=A0A7X5F471_9HYPH|nr:AlpA family phage regulatory protein [Pannonibacter sp. XCT-53]NBN79431.1 AlpA family phage regulatory protein [Pannonibacter sp. XCT-53]
MKDRVMRRKEVEEATGLKRSCLYAAIAAGQFPRQIRLTNKSVGWLESEILEWIRARQRVDVQEG